MSRYRDSMLSVCCCSAVWAAAWSALHVVTWSHVCAPVCGLSAQCIMWCASVLPECAYI